MTTEESLSREIEEATSALVELVKELCVHEAYTEYRTYDIYMMEHADEQRIREAMAVVVAAERKDERERVTREQREAIIASLSQMPGVHAAAGGVQAWNHVAEATPAEGGTEG